MKSYLVGGAVRDSLLDLPVSERDWVVVGATPGQMLELGYQQAGRDFPVFLHPKNKEEHALARTERKSGNGYTSFICHATPDITLEADLLRRDLTINAIAQTEEGELIDPYSGQQDLKQRLLRHVSQAFQEDPLRVLRVARFAARFTHLGFHIAEETLALMEFMTRAGELAFLMPERVWKETEKALATHSPQVYFQVLRDCGALAVLFPEIDNLYCMPTLEQWNPEIDSGVHALRTLMIASSLSLEIDVRFATLCQDVGKVLTLPEQSPRHHERGPAGVKLVEKMCQRLRVPNALRDLAKLVTAYHDLVHTVMVLQPITLMKLFYDLDVWRKPRRLEKLALTIEANSRSLTQFEESHYPQGDYLRKAFFIASGVTSKSVVADGFQGIGVRDELHRRRVAALTEWKTKQTLSTTK
ncbi:MAG: multifunctional CCA addition/repair protein [Candidatus Malihini olakiniferum]